MSAMSAAAQITPFGPARRGRSRWLQGCHPTADIACKAVRGANYSA